MRRSFLHLLKGVLFSFPLLFASCGNGDNALEEIINGGGSGGSSTVTEITIDLTAIADEYLNADKTQLNLIEGNELTLKFIIQPAELADTEVTLTSEDGEIVSIEGKTVKALKPGTTKVTAKAGEKTCVVTVVVESALTIPLTLEALTAGTIVINDYKEGMQYSLDGGVTKITITTNPTEITVAVGDKVQFYGHGTDIQTYRNPSSTTGTSISGGTAECKVYGNIMSLVDEFGFAENTTLSNAYNFGGLFWDNAKLKEAKYLKLPATTLTTGCYNHMFKECTELTTAPELPALNLNERCYHGMFIDCSKLTTAPELPAGGTSGGALAIDCYHEMFRGCASLTTAPALPALNLNERCYQGMFIDCSKLTTAPELPAGGTSGGALADYCYQEMFALCSNLTAAPALPASPLTKNCYWRMFSGCSKLEETPHLASTSLAENCYYQMFEGCTGLKKAYVKAAYTINNHECYEMFSGCTNLDDGRKFYSSDAENYKTEFGLNFWTAKDYE